MKRSIILFSLVFVLSYITFTPSFTANAKYYPDNVNNVYVHGQKEGKFVALTFDDGPHEIKTEKILSVLDKYGVKGTFFVIGQNAEKHPEILKKIKEKGHEIGNHTYDHKSIYKLDAALIINEVEKCSEVIENITGSSTRLFRPPEGFMNDVIASGVRKEGYDVVLWKIDTYDWKGKNASEIAENVVKNVRSGDIVLMHDYIWRKSHTDEALDIIIPALIKQGYRFVTVSQLIGK